MSSARNEGRSPQGTPARKANPRGNPKSNGKDTGKDRKHGNCTQRTEADSCSFEHDSDKQGKGKRMISPSFYNETTETRKVTEKEIPKGKNRMELVRQVGQTSGYASIKKGNDKQNPHVVIGTRQNAHHEFTCGCTRGINASLCKPVATEIHAVGM